MSKKFGRHRHVVPRRRATRVAVLAASTALLVGFGIAPAFAVPNDNVFVFADGTVLDQSIDDYCQEFFDEFHSGGCTVDYEETSGEFFTGESVRVSRDGTTCPGQSPNRVTVTETRTFTRTLGFSIGLGLDRKFGEKAGNTAKAAGQFNYSEANSEGTSVGFSGAIQEGHIGTVLFAPKFYRSVGQARFTDQYGDTVSTEVSGDTPVKVDEFVDGVYSVDQRPMTAAELTTFCGTAP